MKFTRKLSSIRRYSLPAICAVLTYTCAVFGEQFLVDYADITTVGPLTAAQVAALFAGGFLLLTVITFLLAVFPGKEISDTEIKNKNKSSNDLKKVDLIKKPVKSSEPDEHVEKIISALKNAVAKEKSLTDEANQKIDEQDTTIRQLRDELQTYYDQTAPDFKTFKNKCAEEANQKTFVKVNEITEAANKQASALRKARDAAEQESTRKSNIIVSKDQEIVDLKQKIVDTRIQSAADEYVRIKIAIEAINDTSIDFLDPLQRQAVDRHAQRIREGFDRIDPSTDHSYGPVMSMPPMTQISMPTLAEEKDSSAKRSWGKKKRKE